MIGDDDGSLKLVRHQKKYQTKTYYSFRPEMNKSNRLYIAVFTKQIRERLVKN